ncbi:MAG: phosphatase PAP2 family protein [Haliea sp.]|uniref:phosphatase PAP2 family protein n=1 Tax=Haliea sp. TaxID=1932666 RepID=UPI0032EE2F62
MKQEHIFFGVWFAFLVAMMGGRWLQLDTVVADTLYRLQGNAWTLQNHVLTKDVIHEGGRRLSQAMGVFVVGALLASQIVPALRSWRRPLLFLFLAVALSTLTVSVIKQLVSMDCPWSLQRYGGTREFIGLLQRRPADYPDSACFPSGHASAGYSWLALFFFFKATRPRWRWAGLFFALTLGLVFGFAQQLRGAHFLSHDLWTLVLCWSVSFTLAKLLLANETAGGEQTWR